MPASGKARLASWSMVAGRFGLGALLLVSGLGKLRHPLQFLNAVYEYELLGERGGVLVAAVLPWAEVVVGACLLTGWFVGGALAVTACLGAIFSLANGVILWRERVVSCGCFGGIAGGEELVSASTLLRAGLVFVVAMTVLALYQRARTLQGSPRVEAKAGGHPPVTAFRFRSGKAIATAQT